MKLGINHGERPSRKAARLTALSCAVPSYERVTCLGSVHVTAHRVLLVRQHVLVKHPHRDTRLHHEWWQDCFEDVRVPIVPEELLRVEVISLAAIKHSLRIISIDSLPEACEQAKANQPNASSQVRRLAKMHLTVSRLSQSRTLSGF